jgi:hypothetical protein
VNNVTIEKTIERCTITSISGDSRLEMLRRNEIRGCRRAAVRGAWSPSQPQERERSAVGAQVEQAARFAQIEGVESLLEPLVDREDDITYHRRAGAAMMQASEAHGGAQLE